VTKGLGEFQKAPARLLADLGIVEAILPDIGRRFGQ
jgi:hypothetical protein